MKDIKPEDLVIHFLNVGFGDNVVVELPADSSGQRSYGIVDCTKFDKTRSYLNKLMDLRPGQSQLAFLCATHPHLDHIRGIRRFLQSEKFRPRQVWDSGFHHASQTYQKILETIYFEGIDMVRVSSGVEWYFGRVQITALAPSILLRNRYATYGVDINNASIVLRLEHHKEEQLWTRSVEASLSELPERSRAASQSVVILAGDAEFDSWSHISQEFPKLERQPGHDPHVKRMVNYLACGVIKVAHHGSMHSSPLDVYEKMAPELAIISSEQKLGKKTTAQGKLERYLFPHDSTIVALNESGTRIVTTDGSYERQTLPDGSMRDPNLKDPGTIVVVIPPGGRHRMLKLNDAKGDVPDPPLRV